MYFQAPIIYDELYSSKNFDSFVNNLKHIEQLKIKEYEVSGKKTVLITRDKNNLNLYNKICNECSIIIINSDYSVIAKSINKIHEYEETLSEFTNINSNKSAFIEEYIPGVLVVLSKVDNTYLISTKTDIHGKNYFPGTKTPVTDIFLEEINRNVIFGLDALFNRNGFSDECSWSFILNKGEQNNYNLHLISCVEIENGVEITPKQLDALADELNLKRPKKISISNKDNLYNKAVYVKNNSEFKFKKVIIINNYGDRLFFNVKSELNTIKRGISNKLEKMVELSLNNEKYYKRYHEIINSVEEKELFEFINKSINKIISHNKEIYENININSKSRKQFAFKVSKNPMSKAMFALKDKKITNLNEILKIMSKKDILKIIDKNYKNDFREFIKELKNKNGN